MLIATIDMTYAGLLSEYISEHYPDTIEVSVFNGSQGLQETVSARRYDVALFDTASLKEVKTMTVHLPLLLWSEHEADDTSIEIGKVHKYRRISSIVADVLEHYAKVTGSRRASGSQSANITVVWSPAGGVGTTTVALAYASSLAQEGKEALYLNLETFSSIPAYFSNSGKSISTVFEMLESNRGDVKMLLQGIRCNESNIKYLCGPDNYDDISILSTENIFELVTICGEITEELVIDLSCACDARTRQVFELADKVLLTTDPTLQAQVKLAQFISQNNVFESIKEKTTLVGNKGALINKPPTSSLVHLPVVHSSDPASVYKSLSETGFKREV